MTSRIADQTPSSAPVSPANNPACDSKYECTITLEEDGQGVRFISLEICRTLYVGLQAESHISVAGSGC